MKNIKNLFFITSIILFAVFIKSCKDNVIEPQEKWNLKYLHYSYTKIWKITELHINGVQIPVPDWLDANRFTFNYDGSGIIAAGEVDIHPQDTMRCDFISWNLYGDVLELKNCFSLDLDGVFDETVRFKVNTLSENLIVLSTDSSFGQKYKYHLVPTVVPNPNASTKNKFLTNGLSKIWKLEEEYLDGKKLEIQEWKADDLIIFNTDGTANFYLGEISSIIGDTTNNDHLNWEFADNETKIIFTNKERIVGSPEFNIIELNEESIITENKVLPSHIPFPDSVIMRVKRVPYIKKQ